MGGIIRLSDPDRKATLRMVPRGGEHRTVRRAHVLLLLADGHPVRFIAAVLFCSFDLIVLCKTMSTANPQRRWSIPEVEASVGCTRIGWLAPNSVT